MTNGESNIAMRWPNLFVVGAAKAGTTALHAMLSQHPDVAMSSVKEPHFFIDALPDPETRHIFRPVRDRGKYLGLFDLAGNPAIVGDASPSYLYAPEAPSRIKATSPDAKIIILLRDPVERAFSHFLMDVREGSQRLDFMAALLDDEKHERREFGTNCHCYVDLGLYRSQVRRYREAFSSDQVLVLESARLKASPTDVLSEVAQFLGIASEPLIAAGQSPIDDNAYAEPRSGISSFVMRQAWVRQAAKRAVPTQLRRRIRDQVLLAEAEKPQLPAEARRWLIERFAVDLSGLRADLGLELDSLSAHWG